MSAADDHHNGQEEKHLPCVETLREQVSFSLEKEWLQVIQRKALWSGVWWQDEGQCVEVEKKRCQIE